MIKHEAKFCSELNIWLNHFGESVIKTSAPIEAKISTENKPFNLKSGFKTHQIPTLIQAKKRVHAYKLSDEDQKQKPYDIAFYCQAPSLIAIMWIRKGNKTFYLIEPEEINKLIDIGIKSLNEGMAKTICFYEGTLR